MRPGLPIPNCAQPITVPANVAGLLDAYTMANGQCGLLLGDIPQAICSVRDLLRGVGLPLHVSTIVERCRDWYGSVQAIASYDFIAPHDGTNLDWFLNVATWMPISPVPVVLVHWNRDTRLLGRPYGLPVKEWWTDHRERVLL